MSSEADLAVWQVAGGTSDRPYADLFLKHRVALIGPGDAGKWTEQRDKDPDFPGVVKLFAKGPEVGDVLVLRSGVRTILAVGLIASGYDYLTQFDDVQGWDLQHARRVRWFRLPEPHEFEGRILVAKRFSRVWHQKVIDFAMRVVHSSLTAWKTADLPALLPEEPELAELPTGLGLVVGGAGDLLRYWEDDYPNNMPSEDEAVAHLIVPFLKALGWPVESIAIKWRNIDIALFDPPPRKPANCRLVVEAKCPGTGLEGALGQAKRYVRKLGLLSDILATDGIRYRLFSAERSYEQTAYANFTRLKDSAHALFDALRYLPQEQGG